MHSNCKDGMQPQAHASKEMAGVGAHTGPSESLSGIINDFSRSAMGVQRPRDHPRQAESHLVRLAGFTQIG